MVIFIGFNRMACVPYSQEKNQPFIKKGNAFMAGSLRRAVFSNSSISGGAHLWRGLTSIAPWAYDTHPLANRSLPITLDLKEIKELIALMRKNDLSVFKMEKQGFKITLKKGTDFQPVISTTTPAQHTVSVAPAAVSPPDAPGPAKETSNLREITSPMVGTFYSATTPDAPPYVNIGQEVTEDTVVCIIEAMKVMNEIKAETRGVLAEVVAENGKPVQYGQPLFRIR
jgi:acetyl-CoA carboxylase biotin carboxyl carrier protein